MMTEHNWEKSNCLNDSEYRDIISIFKCVICQSEFSMINGLEEFESCIDIIGYDKNCQVQLVKNLLES